MSPNRVVLGDREFESLALIVASLEPFEFVDVAGRMGLKSSECYRAANSAMRKIKIARTCEARITRKR